MKRAMFLARPDRPLFFHAASLLVAFGSPAEPGPFTREGTAAVVTITGPLMQHADPWCWWDSYDDVLDRVKAAAASDASEIILKIDSPGGDALGCFEAARALRAICTTAGKRLVAFCDGMICSAAYALACAASKIVAPPAGLIGSIGCVQSLIDVTAQDAQYGVKYAFASSGKEKLDGNPHLPVSEEVLSRTQAKVQELADLFFEFVAEMRPGLDAGAIASLEAATMLGNAAKKSLLIDAVADWQTAMTIAASKDDGQTQTPTTTTETPMAMTKKEAKEYLSKLADGDSEEAKKMKEALAAIDEGGDGDEGGEKKEEAKAEEESPKSKSEPEKKEEAKASTSLALVGRIHALEAREAQRERAEKVEKLLAQRPDFSKETKAQLRADASIEFIEKAVKNWPKVVGLVSAEAEVQGTRGAGQSGDGDERTSRLPPTEAKALRERMGLEQPVAKIVRERNTMTFPVISPEAAASKKATA